MDAKAVRRVTGEAHHQVENFGLEGRTGSKARGHQLRALIPGQSRKVSAAMYHPQYQYIVILDAIDDDLFSDWEAVPARTKIIVARATNVRVSCKQKESVGDGSMRRLAISELALSVVTYSQIASRSATTLGDRRCAISVWMMVRGRGELGRAASPPQGPASTAA
jgi:hypothetical protein